jgi:hypothetical protein
MRWWLTESVAVPNTTIRLGPNVVLDFTDASDDVLPLSFGPGVTLTSVSGFPSVTVRPSRDNIAGAMETERSGRTPHSLGPLLKFGPHRSDEERIFLEVRCVPGFQLNDGVRISGFRLHGPSFDQQSTDDIGIHIDRCVDVEVSNMEIAGWGGKGIHVLDRESDPRIDRPDQIRIFGNYIHHNQHPVEDGHAAGYGVEVNHGAWAQIYENVFDFNRHAIAAAGDAGGYDAERNLVLKGGGYHDGFLNSYTHMFDVHGTGCRWSADLCGDAGIRFSFVANAFQYRKDNAIKIRGKPADSVYIAENVFPHPGLEDDWGDDAINLNTSENVDIGRGNVINFDSFGKYGVCDFDGDAVDDLFLPTGATWWYSSGGEFPWSYLNFKKERLDQVRLG